MIFLKTYESFNKSCYYHSSPEFLGDNFEFKPEGYYEEIGENNQPIMMFDEHMESDIPEICASKYIGGCVMGSFSTNKSNKFFIYEICENPDKDISHWLDQDFPYLEEVRYRHTVTGKYIGTVTLTEYQKGLFDCFYKQQEMYANGFNDEDEEFNQLYDKYWDDIENGKLTKEVKKMKANK